MELDIRYVAGLFDGEGWITICKQKLGGYRQYADHYTRYQLVAGIGMTYRPIIEAVHSQFGGGFHLKKEAKIPNCRTGFLWKISSQPAADFLELIEPYLVVKKDEARIAMGFQRHVRRHINDFRYRPEMREGLYAERDEFYFQLRALKKREFDDSMDGDPMIAA